MALSPSQRSLLSPYERGVKRGDQILSFYSLKIYMVNKEIEVKIMYVRQLFCSIRLKQRSGRTYVFSWKKNLFAGLSPYRFKLTQNCDTRYEVASHLTFNEKASPILS